MSDSPLEKSDGPIFVSILVEGSEIDDTIDVASVRVVKEIGRIPKAVVVFLDGDVAGQEFPLADNEQMVPGANIEIRVGFGQRAEKLFKGIITAQRLRIGSGSSPTRLEVTCRDQMITTHTVRKTTFFQKKKDSEIISSLLKDASSSTSALATKDEARNQVQYDCTDWDFARALSERNGFVLIADDGEVSAKNPKLDSPVLTITLGDDLIQYDVETDALDQLSEAECSSWDDAQATAFKMSGEGSTPPKFGSLTAKKLSEAVKKPVKSTRFPAWMDAGAALAQANARLQRAELARIRGTVTYPGSVKAIPGTVIELVGVSKKFSGDGFVSAIEHDVSDGMWTTEATLGLAPEWRSDTEGLSGAPAAGLTAPVQGLQIGIVTRLTMSPDGEPTIEVGLPMLGDDTKLEARYAAPYAGKDRGFMMIPEIGDEVVLGFMSEHPDHPIILGSMHSRNSPRPEPGVDEENNIKTFVSRERLKMTFDEKNKSILLETPDEQSILIDDGGKAITIADMHGNTIVMNDKGILLDSASDINLNAAKDVTIKAGNNCTVSGVTVSAAADSEFSASGSGSAELTSGGILKVQGSLVQIN